MQNMGGSWVSEALGGTAREGGLTEAQLSDELGPTYRELPPALRNARATISWWQVSSLLPVCLVPFTLPPPYSLLAMRPWVLCISQLSFGLPAGLRGKLAPAFCTISRHTSQATTVRQPIQPHRFASLALS